MSVGTDDGAATSTILVGTACTNTTDMESVARTTFGSNSLTKDCCIATIALPSDLIRALEVLSQQTGRPESDLVEAVEVYIALRKHLGLRSIDSGANPDLHSDELEDWLAASLHLK
jgi:hypothetical protein